MTRTQEEAYTLIENLATSSSNQNEEYGRSRKGGNSEIKKLEEMCAKIDMLMQRDQRVCLVVVGLPAQNFPELGLSG
ncbi:BnaUnng01750D [Brassica napus]|uniref:BnaUnng01750D protein n=1 Tax=Brassica napus TaxID=3708 RepID=A0A078JH46_BRANA|nr:BnaUnng01750D [Brassica napus]